MCVCMCVCACATEALNASLTRKRPFSFLFLLLLSFSYSVFPFPAHPFLLISVSICLVSFSPSPLSHTHTLFPVAVITAVFGRGELALRSSSSQPQLPAALLLWRHSSPKRRLISHTFSTHILHAHTHTHIHTYILIPVLDQCVSLSLSLPLVQCPSLSHLLRCRVRANWPKSITNFIRGCRRFASSTKRTKRTTSR